MGGKSYQFLAIGVQFCELYFGSGNSPNFSFYRRRDISAIHISPEIEKYGVKGQSLAGDPQGSSGYHDWNGHGVVPIRGANVLQELLICPRRQRPPPGNLLPDQC
jgi:hypothetical protein